MTTSDPFSEHFFGLGEASARTYGRWMNLAQPLLAAASPDSPAYSGLSPQRLQQLLAYEIFPPSGVPPELLQERLALVLQHSIQPWHPFTAAHLHTPVLSCSLAAEAVLSAWNQSMDSFDQAPAASVIEQQMLDWLCRLAGLPAEATGTFTAGGTQSNYLGLLLARDHALSSRLNWNTRERGLPPDAHRLRFLCSEVAHFSVEKSAIQLGLGTQAVTKVACDETFRMRPDQLRRHLAALRAEGLWPAAIVATAGTTDFGSIDPLEEIAAIARQENLWLHVDAAYGGALLLSNRYRDRLAGIGQADSITIDFHKAFFQPISCSAFLLADARRFETIRVYADYLNTETREADGIPDLVTRSVLTTRRFDALKLWVSLQALGKDLYSALIERLVELAALAAQQIRLHPDFELVAPPQFGTVVFRFRPHRPDAALLNQQIPETLFATGKAVIGHTVVHGESALKLTLCNPATTEEHLRELLDLIATTGHACQNDATTSVEQLACVS